MLYLRVIWKLAIVVCYGTKMQWKSISCHTHHHPSWVVCWFTLWPEFPNCRYFDMSPNGTPKHMVRHLSNSHWVWWWFGYAQMICLLLSRPFVWSVQKYLNFCLSFSLTQLFNSAFWVWIFYSWVWVWKIGYLNAF